MSSFRRWKATLIGAALSAAVLVVSPAAAQASRLYLLSGTPTNGQSLPLTVWRPLHNGAVADTVVGSMFLLDIPGRGLGVATSLDAVTSQGAVKFAPSLAFVKTELATLGEAVKLAGGREIVQVHWAFVS